MSQILAEIIIIILKILSLSAMAKKEEKSFIPKPIPPPKPIQPPKIPPSQPPSTPPPPSSSPPKVDADVIIQVKKGVNWSVKFFEKGTMCNPQNQVSYNIIKKESSSMYDWYFIKVNIPKSEKAFDTAIMHVITSANVEGVMPRKMPIICNGNIKAFSITVNYLYPENYLIY
jgi:hypothetical protein